MECSTHVITFCRIRQPPNAVTFWLVQNELGISPADVCSRVQLHGSQNITGTYKYKNGPARIEYIVLPIFMTMTDYYEPTLLFRNNAIRRFNPELSPIVSTESLSSTISNSYSPNASWILNANNPQDNEVLNKSCSLNRLNIKSNYWKIPDNNMNLTAISICNQDSDISTLAISSGNNEANLFIYELNMEDNYLTHHNTITLPNINSIKWLNSKYLITGNNKGYAHLVSIPSIDDQLAAQQDGEEVPAEICKRFNHRKHLRKNNEPNQNISKINCFDSTNNLLSLYSNNLFFWDIRNSESQAKPSPISISTIPGIKNFDPVPESSTNVGICGKFGVSLFDLRQPKFNVPTSVIQQAQKLKLCSNIMKWNPDNKNVFAAAHDDSVVRLWVIRKQDSFAQMKGHLDSVVSMEWNHGDLFTGGHDGNIIHWDFTTDTSKDSLMNCGLKEGFSSINFDPKQNRMEKTISERQCGTLLPASNTNIIGMCSVNGSDSSDLRVLSIDGSSFFGMHSKIYDAVDITINSEKVYYSEEDIKLLMAGQQLTSNVTLVNDSNDSLTQTQPLEISRKQSLADSLAESLTEQNNNQSKETLLDAEVPSHKLNLDFEDDFNFGPSNFSENSANSQATIYSVDSQTPYSVAPQPDIKSSSVGPNANVSAYSINTNQADLSSPESNDGLFNDSMDTLSTSHTYIDESPDSSAASSPMKPSDSFNFKLIDDDFFKLTEKPFMPQRTPNPFYALYGI